jgi:hypothetical protein
MPEIPPLIAKMLVYLALLGLINGFPGYLVLVWIIRQLGLHTDLVLRRKGRLRTALTVGGWLAVGTLAALGILLLIGDLPGPPTWVAAAALAVGAAHGAGLYLASSLSCHLAKKYLKAESARPTGGGAVVPRP